MKTIAIIGIAALVVMALGWFRRPRRRVVVATSYTLELVPLQREFYRVKYSEADWQLALEAEVPGNTGDRRWLCIDVPEHVHQSLEKQRLIEIEHRIKTAAATLHYTADFRHLGSMSSPPIEPL